MRFNAICWLVFFGFKTKKTHLWQCQHNGWICNLIFWLFDFALFFFLRIDVKNSKFVFSLQMPIFNAPKCLGLELRNRKFMISSCIRIAFNISSYIIDCQFPVHHLFTMRWFTYWMPTNVFNQIQIRYSPLSDCDSQLAIRIEVNISLIGTYLTTSHTHTQSIV